MWVILFMENKEVILGVVVQDGEVGLKILSNIPFTIMYKLLMVIWEVDIGLGPVLLPPIIQVWLVNHLF